jgi:hypothetical protein
MNGIWVIAKTANPVPASLVLLAIGALGSNVFQRVRAGAKLVSSF